MYLEWIFEYKVPYGIHVRNKISPFFSNTTVTAIALFPLQNPANYRVHFFDPNSTFFFGTVVTLNNREQHRQEILRISHEKPELRAEYDLMPDGVWVNKLST